MKLQFFSLGQWRNVVEFDAASAPEVEDAAASLARACGGLQLAVVHDDGQRRTLNERGVFRAPVQPAKGDV